MIKSGYFLITDISGYTQFLSESELLHSNEIIRTLLNSQIENIKAPFKVSRLQGDAIQTYALGHEITHPRMIIEMVEHLYFEFKILARKSYSSVSCDCDACSNINILDLKIIVHHGDFLIQNIAGREELQGREVILAHRLEKNSIKETYGFGGYVVFTETAIHEAQMDDELTSKMVPHKEKYDHIGGVNLFVYDLENAWREEQDRRKNVDKSSSK